ncbi:MAG: Spx/MgsR family RNA polymerase-binding regulatory protein [Bacteriovoracaceae bacterium]|nr:Spx/MgsR family RNA polymerase-binding regulatory protein [Bacteriovoracaceae bacterium]
MKMYGIPNCDTVKKARTFLEKKKIAYEFVDFKKTPPTASDIERWKKAFGEWPLNKRGPTFRKNQEEFEKLSEAKIPAFIIANSSMIKRPILERDGKVLVFGFDEEAYKKLSK